MNCTEALTLVPLHVTGELDAARAAELTGHLRDCASCAAAAEAGQHTAEPIAPPSRPPAGALRWVFAAAGLVAALVIGLGSYREMHPVAAPSILTAAAGDHHAEVVDRQPREWQTDRASINKLAAQQGIPIAAIVSFAQDGFRLEQGRLGRLDSLVYLHLVYANGEQRFSLYLRQPATPESVPNHDSIDTANLGADHVASFTTAS